MTQIIRLREGQSWPGAVPLRLADLPALVATAGRAPSVFNTQPWQFRVSGHALDMHADTQRSLPALDPAGREMLISCGAALYGLRLAVRQLGYVPAVALLPDPARPGLLARVHLGTRAPITPAEQDLLAAVPHRHTHRGPFSPGPLPAGLLAGFQEDAAAEGAALVMVDDPAAYRRLAGLAAAAGAWRRPKAQAEVRQWTRTPGSGARDGVPACAYPPPAAGPDGTRGRGRLPQRDFDLGRGWDAPPADGVPPAATAVMITAGDTPADWLRAGQALQRLLLRAASNWVSASLYTEPLEFGPIRGLIRSGLRLAGAPQMVLQFGRVQVAQATARRPVSEVLSLP
jgi:hypothetical protein